MVRIFILFHDCCHGSFFSSRWGNTVLGYVSGIFTFTPFEDWKYGAQFASCYGWRPRPPGCR